MWPSGADDHENDCENDGSDQPRKKDSSTGLRVQDDSAAGEYISNTIDVRLAKPNDPQAYGSALTYGWRYSIMATWLGH